MSNWIKCSNRLPPVNEDGESCSILSGNCFRAESDVQAWLDAMKNALDD